MRLWRLIPFRLLLVLVAGLAFVSFGQGVGWWSGANQGDDPSAPREATKSDKPALPEEASSAGSEGPKASDESTARAGAAAAESAAKERAAAEAAAEADRAGALAALDADVAARVELVADSVRRGAFHAACDAIAELDPKARAKVADALRAVALAAGWPELHGEVRDPAPFEATTLSLQGRLVRTAKDATAVRVLSQEKTDATLRVAGPAGVTFPKYPIHRLEPDSVRADEAAELGYAAYAQSDYAAARVWCAIAIAKSREISARAEQLKALLR
jgi:pilus assembly protein FimV